MACTNPSCKFEETHFGQRCEYCGAYWGERWYPFERTIMLVLLAVLLFIVMFVLNIGANYVQAEIEAHNQSNTAIAIAYLYQTQTATNRPPSSTPTASRTPEATYTASLTLTFTPSNTPYATVTLTRTPIPSSTNTATPDFRELGNGQCPSPTIRSQLVPSQVAVANDSLRLRASPSIRSDILGNIRPAELVTLIHGPVCSFNWLWWQIRTNNGQVGWIVEVGRGGEIRGGGIYLLLPEGSELGPDTNRVKQTATTGPNTRMWTHPDISVGDYEEIPMGITVEIEQGPVSGRIRYDSDIEGEWYFIRFPDGSNSGWIWEGRLIFND